MTLLSRIDAVDAALPQTQCTRCGYDDCRRYAIAIAEDRAATNRCPPGGDVGVQRLSAVVGATALPLDPSCGREGPRQLAVIDENWCIGCALCLAVCPVDAIAGAAKRMHTVIDAHCTGCELCVPVCPVDCISLVEVTVDRTGWAAWSVEQADAARRRYDAHRTRSSVKHERSATGEAWTQTEGDADIEDMSIEPSARAEAESLTRRRAAVAAALARVRASRNA